MMIRKLDRYLFRATMGPLLFALAAFTSLFAGSNLINLVQVVVKYSVPFDVAARLFLYQLPQTLTWTAPMSVLLAIILALSRLSANSEVVVMQTSGVPFRRLMAPMLVVGLLMTAFTLFLNEVVTPAANMAYKKLYAEGVQKGQLATVSKNILLQDYMGSKISRIIFAGEFDSATGIMRDVSVTEFEDGQPVRQINAARMVWQKDSWFLENGEVYVYGRRQENKSGVVRLEFLNGQRRFTMERTPQNITQQQKRTEEMNMAELAAQAKLWSGDAAKSRYYRTQFHLRLAIPFASLFFSFLGVTLGIQPHRAAKSVGFGLSIVIIFIYYILLTLGTTIAQSGSVVPWLGAWIQNIIMLAIGVVLAARVKK